MELLMSSNGIMDMIELYRGESKLRAPLAKGFAENSGKYYTPQKSFARHIGAIDNLFNWFTAPRCKCKLKAILMKKNG